MALRPWLRPSSTASRNGSHKLVDGTGWGGCCSEALNSTPNPVVTSSALAGFAVAFPFEGSFSGLGLTGFAASDPVVTSVSLAGFAGARRPQGARRTHPDPGRFEIGAGGLPTHPGLLLDAPQWPSEPSQGNHLLFFRFAQDVAHIDEGYRALRRIQRPRASFSLAGFG